MQEEEDEGEEEEQTAAGEAEEEQGEEGRGEWGKQNISGDLCSEVFGSQPQPPTPFFKKFAHWRSLLVKVI